MAIERNELLALMIAASYMVVVDGKVYRSEKRVLRVLFHVVKITAEEREQMAAETSIEDVLQNIKSQEGRKGLVQLVSLVAGSDGSYQLEERKYLQSIMKRFGFSYSDFSFFDEQKNLDVMDVRDHATDIIELARSLSGVNEGKEEDDAHVNAIISPEKFDDSNLLEDIDFNITS